MANSLTGTVTVLCSAIILMIAAQNQGKCPDYIVCHETLIITRFKSVKFIYHFYIRNGSESVSEFGIGNVCIKAYKYSRFITFVNKNINGNRNLLRTLIVIFFKLTSLIHMHRFYMEEFTQVTIRLNIRILVKAFILFRIIKQVCLL